MHCCLPNHVLVITSLTNYAPSIAMIKVKKTSAESDS